MGGGWVLKHNFKNQPSSAIIEAYKHEDSLGSYDKIRNDYKDPATQYAFDVLNEKYITSRAVKLDSFRHVQDLRRQTEDPNFEYHYDLNETRRLMVFAKNCPEPGSGHPMPLADWQKSMLCKVVGWKDKHGNHRFTDVVLSVARANGKTYLSNILIMYYYLCMISKKINPDKAKNQDAAYVATITSQADKGWRYIIGTFNHLAATKMFRRQIRNRGMRIISDKMDDNNQNTLKKMTQKSGVFDSFHFRLCVIDECGSSELSPQKINDNKQKINSGMQKIHGQLIQISTAYPDAESYLYREEQDMKRVMEDDSSRDLDDHLCIIYEQDSVDEVDQPHLWYKSNPLLYLSKSDYDEQIDTMIKARDAARVSGDIAQFENKNLNVWLAVKQNTFLQNDEVEDAVVDQPPIDIDGRTCYIGIDKGYANDDAAVSFNFPYRDKNGGKRNYVYPHAFIPLHYAQMSIVTKSKQDGIDYEAAEKLGFCEITKDPAGFVRDDDIYDYIVNFVNEHHLDVMYICVDDWHLELLKNRLSQEAGFNILPVRQGTRTLNDPTTYFREMMGRRQIDYLDDPIFKYMLRNAITVSDNNGIKIDKEKSHNKIDEVDATINCFTRIPYYFIDINPDAHDDSSDPTAGWSKQRAQEYWTNFTF